MLIQPDPVRALRDASDPLMLGFRLSAIAFPGRLWCSWWFKYRTDDIWGNLGW